jgi:hypothetical protein
METQGDPVMAGILGGDVQPSSIQRDSGHGLAIEGQFDCIFTERPIERGDCAGRTILDPEITMPHRNLRGAAGQRQNRAIRAMAQHQPTRKMQIKPAISPRKLRLHANPIPSHRALLQHCHSLRLSV